MSIADEVLKIVNQADCPSNALDKLNREIERNQDWEKEETIYIFEDGSKIIDNNVDDLTVINN
jgi:hypothetical protein